MSNLQIGLAVLGALILVALLIHASWTSKKSVPRQAEPLLSQQELDALGVNSNDPQFAERTGGADFSQELLAAQSAYGTLSGESALKGSISGVKATRHTVGTSLSLCHFS